MEVEMKKKFINHAGIEDEDKSEIEDEEDDEDLPPRIGMDSDDKDNSEQRFIRQALRSIPSMSKHLRSPEHNRTTLRYVHSYKSYLWNHAASMRVQKNGHFLLTNLLLETMKNTARVSHKEGRIVNVSSEGHRFAYSEGVRFDKINDESSFNTIYAYGQSKLANILHANELARRLKEEGVKITANSLHPGAIATNLLRHHGFLDGQDSRID